MIGAGNISNTRHIPAILKNPDLHLIGIISDDETKIKRTLNKYNNISHTLFDKKVRENTPKFLEVQLSAGSIPVQMFMNFNSPICEWGLLLLCEKKIAIYDYFKDILIVIDNDNFHLAKDVLKVSTQFFFSFWKGFIVNGFKLVRNSLLYGHDLAIASFVNAVKTGRSDEKMSGATGQAVVHAMNRVVTLVQTERNICQMGRAPME